MDLEKIDEIKRLALIAMFSDDELFEMLVLKGGNAIDLVYNIDGRSSRDLDFSIESDLSETERRRFQGKIEAALTTIFREKGYAAFDIRFSEMPGSISDDMKPFWGGYGVEFKVLDGKRFGELSRKLELARREAQVFDEDQGKRFYIEISKLEYCKMKQRATIDDYGIYVYSPEMIALEKVRAICQQMSEYGTIVRNPSRSLRAQDFYDFFLMVEHFKIDLTTRDNLALLRSIFAAKRVPLQFIERIPDYREYHRSDFDKVVKTVRPNVKLKEYDFYFDYMAGRMLALKSLWVEELPLR